MAPGPVVTFGTLRNNLFWDDDKTPDSGAAYSIDIPSPAGTVDLQIEDGLAFCGEAYSYPSTSLVGFDSLEDDNSKSIIDHRALQHHALRSTTHARGAGLDLALLELV